MKREVLMARPGHEESFRATFTLRDDLKGHPYWEDAFEYAATRQLTVDEINAIGPALVRIKDANDPCIPADYNSGDDDSPGC